MTKTTNLESIDNDNLGAVTGGAHVRSKEISPGAMGFDLQSRPLQTFPPVGTNVLDAPSNPVGGDF